jgi:ATP-binding cassette subfamily B protein RaxB
LDIEVDQVSFRYSESEPWVLHKCNLSIPEGESIAIVGPSGCGKTTLAKLILGLLTPTEGQIRVGGVDIRQFGLGNFREHTGSVMQSDELFEGSIADNISFFDDAATPLQIEAAARQAAIHDDIVAMPMGYETLVGNMGASLSGGQKQRIVLARAFYRKPRVLVFDEATSHLDVQCERAVNAATKRTRATQIVIAHRQETIAMATRVFDLGAVHAERKQFVDDVEMAL